MLINQPRNSNKKLNKAFGKKDDEFYTRLEDIQKELESYKLSFAGKKVLCNCDDYKTSEFVRYFAENFFRLRLQSLTVIGFKAKKRAKLVQISQEIQGFPQAALLNDSRIDISKTSNNGDFRHKENMELLSRCDLVVTNPPFSLFRSYIDVLIGSRKKFLIIGNCNAISYRNCFRYIADGLMWTGNNSVRWFKRPDDTVQEGARSYWFTNLKGQIDGKKKLILTKHYSPEQYPRYDNYKAIEVSRVRDIPLDYQGTMGVPLTFLEKYNPKQFEILGADYDIKTGRLALAKKSWNGKLDRAYLNGKRLYSRVLIRNRNLGEY